MHGRIFNARRLALTLGLVTLTACSMFGGTGKPTTVIVSPPSGSQYRDGEDVAVQTTSTDATGIVRVELIVDNVIVRTDPAPNPQATFSLIQTWKATPGNHTLIVRAYNSAGSTSDPAAISVSVLQEVAQAGSSSASSSAASSASSISSAPPPVSSSSSTVSVSSASSASSAASSVACVNGSAFVADVTIPDGTNMAPLQEFSKVWRISNTGACSWDAGYHLVHTSGTAMTTGIAVAVSATAPGATADVSVPMKAPAGSGLVTGVWRMRAPNGALFGNTVTIKINVVGGSSSSAAPPSSSASSSAAPGTCSGTPNIASFTGPAATVNYATDFTLNWGAVTNADSVEIDNGVGGVATPGNRTLNPGASSGPKTYTLTARCGANVATRQVVVTIGLPPPPLPIGNFNGAWYHNFGTMNLTQSGTSVSGSYNNGSCTGTINGTVSGNTLTGTWGVCGSGPISFTLTDANHFDGTYASTNKWCGAKGGVAFATGCGFAGQWNLNTGGGSGTATLTQINNTISGTYTNGASNGTVSGTLSGWTLNGTWNINSLDGPFTWVIASNNLKFKGHYGSSGWCGWRSGQPAIPSGTSCHD